MHGATTETSAVQTRIPLACSHATVQAMPPTSALYLVKVPGEAGIQDDVQQQHLEDSGCSEGGLAVDRQV